MPKVSVIIPTFNRADFLVKTIETVFNQTFKDFEIIISDDGSTDGTKEMISEFGEKVHYIYNDHTGLPSCARNSAIKMAKGEYLAFLDSDDQWLPDKLNKQIELLENSQGVGLICSNAYVVNSDGKMSEHLYLRQGKGKSGKVLTDLIRDNFIITSTTIVRTKIVKEIGYFSELNELKAVEDYNLWLRIAAKYEIVFIEEPLAIYRDVPLESIRAYNDLKTHWMGILSALNGLKINELDLDSRRIFKTKKSECLSELLKLNWSGFEIIPSIGVFLKLFYLQPLKTANRIKKKFLKSFYRK